MKSKINVFYLQTNIGGAIPVVSSDKALNMLKGCFRERVRASYFIFRVGALKAAVKQITRQLTLHCITKIFPFNGITFLDLIFLACLYPAEFYISLNIKDDLRLRAYGGNCAWKKYYDTNENTLLSFTGRMFKSLSLIFKLKHHISKAAT